MLNTNHFFFNRDVNLGQAETGRPQRLQNRPRPRPPLLVHLFTRLPRLFLQAHRWKNYR